MSDYIEGKVREYEARVYPEGMPAHNKNELRRKLEAEDRFWTRFDADFIRGYDDGESQTTVDQNYESNN